MAYRGDWFLFWQYRAALLVWTSLLAPLVSAQPIGDLRLREAADRGRIEPGRKLSRITVTLRRDGKQQAALDELLREQQDPRSPNYHKWLSPEEFGIRFGTSNQDLARVAAWLEAQGLKVESTARGRGWIICSGTARQAETAFRTEIHSYESKNGRLHFAPWNSPSVPTEYVPVVRAIRGLDDLHPESQLRSKPLYTASDGTHYIAPGDFPLLNGFPGPSDGSGQSLVVAGQSAIDPSDLQKFRSTFAQFASTPQVILVGDDPGFDMSGAFQEGEIDMEWAGVAAPRATLIYVYAQDVFDAVSAAVDQNLAPVLSMSYGLCEANASGDEVSAVRSVAQQANAQGITWAAASGDSGAAGCDAGAQVATQGLSVWFPASLPEVTGVGGTEYQEGANGSVTAWGSINNDDGSSVDGGLPEIAWNDGVQQAGIATSGGGASTLFSKPSWQTAPGVPTADARWVPDVSFSASPYHDPYLAYIGGQFYAAGGTSISTPVFAGAMALLNQRMASLSGGVGMGNVNPLLYAFPTLYFDDVTAGNNIVPCGDGTPNCVNGFLGYSAGPGYDPVTGLGSLNGRFLTGGVAPTTTVLNLPASIVVAGTLTLTAQVTGVAGTLPFSAPSVPSLNVMLEDGRGDIVQEQPLVSGIATFELDEPFPTTLVAQYVGDSFFQPSASGTVTILVTPDQPAPILAAPCNQCTGVQYPTSLYWTGARYATSYDVYFGATASPPWWESALNADVFPPPLASNTTYYWSVVAHTPSGPVSSPTWSFTTGQLSGPPILGPRITAVVNAASLITATTSAVSPAVVAPGSLVLVYGAFGIAAPVQAPASPLPTSLAGLSFQIGGVNAPILYASPGVAEIQIPWELAGNNSASVTVSLKGATNGGWTWAIAPSPGVFTANADGLGQGMIFDASGNMVDDSNPASPGSIIQMYCTGLGVVDNPPPTGTPASSTALSRTAETPIVTIGGVAAQVLFSGLTPGTTGEYQINAVVPAGVGGGAAVPVVVSIGGLTSNLVTMAVQD